ncbi:hypothetical protein Neosp_011954 [[Neocosmospora] mangrovei]
MHLSQEQGAIAQNVQNVLSSFRTVAALFKQGARFPDDRCESEDALRLLPTFDNEITRFKMWAGNLAAHQSGPASLDHRLREAPHLQQQVVYLLRDIFESLEDAVSFVPNEESPKGTKDTRHEHLSQQESTDQGNDDDFTDSDLDDDEDISLETRVSSLCADLSEATDCLLRLSVAIANPAPHERFRKLGAGPSEDVSFYEAHDISYVRDKFPRANKALPEVLGKFITRRRQFFKYREAHHAKLAAGLDQEAQRDTSRTEIVPKTVASSLPEHFKGAAVIDEDNRSDMAISETSYATSAGLLVQEDGQVKPATPLKVPPPPPEAEKGAFECPFCYRMIFASTRMAWKRHVFGDLRPYTCLFSRCTDSNTDFDRRHQWQLHVAQYHWRSWSCPFKCRGMFPSSLELEDHIRHQHLPNASNEHLNAVVARGEVPEPCDISKECPLCEHIVSGLKSYVKHVGRHLEQLALFALPDIKYELPEENVESDEQNDVGSEMDARSVDSDVSEVSPRQSHERLETSDIGDQEERWVQSREREASNYGTRTAEDSDEPSVESDSKKGHEPPHLRGEAKEPSVYRDESPDQPLEEHERPRPIQHGVVPNDVPDDVPDEITDEQLEELQSLQQIVGDITSEAPEGQKSISRTDKSSEEAHGSNTGASVASQKRMLSRALAKANSAVDLDNAANFEGAKEAYLEACDLLAQVIHQTSNSEDEHKLQAIMVELQQCFYNSASVTTARVAQQRRPNGRRGAPMEGFMTGKHGLINPIDPPDEPEPAAQGAQPFFTEWEQGRI